VWFVQAAGVGVVPANVDLEHLAAALSSRSFGGRQQREAGSSPRSPGAT